MPLVFVPGFPELGGHFTIRGKFQPLITIVVYVLGVKDVAAFNAAVVELGGHLPIKGEFLREIDC